MNKIAFLFPGQGSQYVGMGKKVFEKFSIAKRVFEEASDILHIDLTKLCFNGDLKELTKTINNQPAILTTSVAYFKILMDQFEIVPTYLLGHSLGEISALTCTGAIKFQDAIKIVRTRGKLMQEAVGINAGAMMAIMDADNEYLKKLCSKISCDNHVLSISNYNSFRQVVVSGHKEAVEELKSILDDKQIKTVMLNVSAPFHCSLMKPAANSFKKELEKYSFYNFSYPVISNVTAKPYGGIGDIVNTLTEQIIHPVMWENSINYIESRGIDTVIDVGPQSILKGMLKKSLSTLKAYSFDDENDIDSLKEMTSMVKNFKHTVVTKCIQIAVCTKNNNWNDVEYINGVVKPYRRIIELQTELENSGEPATLEQMTAALEMLKSVFKTKKTPIKEQEERFNEIFDATKTGELFKGFKVI